MIFAENQIDCRTHIVGGGIIGALESYYAYKEAQREGVTLSIVVYERGDSFNGTNTAYNIVPSLTIDEILSIVPRGSELVEKLSIPFDQPGGIRVDDVTGLHDSESAARFKEAVTQYGRDENHNDRTLSLLLLGKKSMDLWQEMYDEADEELKALLVASNFNPCREPKDGSKRVLHDGYRIDLLYGIPNAEARARGMKADYAQMGYNACALLTPDEVVAIDPSLTDFCEQHSHLDDTLSRVWQNDTVALWRPGGCINTRIFLPKFYGYLKKIMGQYRDANNQMQDCFQIRFGKEVSEVEFDFSSGGVRIVGLKCSDGTSVRENDANVVSRYIFCPGESVGTLERFGFNEPAFAAFAGTSLLVTIPLNSDQVLQYKDFSHCMEVHREGIVLAWQAQYRDEAICIGVGGTKAFYGDKQPRKDEAFAKNRHLVQLNMIKDVLPQFLSIAHEGEVDCDTLSALEEKAILNLWVGRRAVAYDGFPTLGSLYCHNQRVSNARCTTHLGSGGVSFGPGAVLISRSSETNTDDPFVQKILHYSDSRREAK